MLRIFRSAELRRYAQQGAYTMQERFKQWLLHSGKSDNTAYSYSTSINNISKHYSQETNQNIDIYTVNDINVLNEINRSYSQSGKFSDFGNKGKGTKRNAIARYVEFFTQSKTSHTSEPSTHEPPAEESDNQNFSYERDLQISLCSQITDLFPGYRIFGSKSEGIEYTINNRRIDVLLEHTETNELLAVELKSGEADYRVFGQISMYLGILQEKFPSREVKGIIVAGSIQDSLKQAASITEKIQLRTYLMKLELEKA